MIMKHGHLTVKLESGVVVAIIMDRLREAYCVCIGDSIGQESYWC